MTENQKQDREMSRVEAVQLEMASAVRLLGREGETAKAQTYYAARKTGLPITIIQRLRYGKIGRVAADIADQVREAVATLEREEAARAEHERYVLSQRLSAIEARLMAIDPDFYGPDVDALRRQTDRLRREPDLQG